MVERVFQGAVLAERWAAKRPGSISLLHDSNLFAHAGVRVHQVRSGNDLSMDSIQVRLVDAI
jgi:hypothetical protein